MIQYQAIEDTTLLVYSREASATLGDRKGEDFGSSLQTNFIDFFQRFLDIIGTTVHNEVVDSWPGCRQNRGCEQTLPDALSPARWTLG
jgi:hypothetical protein